MAAIIAESSPRCSARPPTPRIVDGRDPGRVGQRGRRAGGGTLNTYGAFAVGPAYGTHDGVGDDILPQHPREAMRSGSAHPVPLIIGNNADGPPVHPGPPLLPTTENRIEALLAGSGAATRDRIIEAYPDYPAPKACVRIGGDLPFASSLWEVVEARAAAPGPHLPTYVYRYDYAPRPLHWSGLGATHATGTVRGVRMCSRPGWARH